MTRPRSWPVVAAPATTGERIRANAALAVCSVPLAAAVVLAYRDGGYFITSWGTAAIVLLGTLASAALVFRGGFGGRLGLIAAASWGALAVWQGLSAIWADEPASSTAAMGLTLLYAATFTIVLVASRGATTLRRMLELSLLVIVPVTLTALGTRLIPGLFGEEEHGRLSTPISYWNNLALLFAFGLVLSVGLAADPSRGRALRAGAASAIPAFPLGVLFAQSRGALLVMVIGCILLLAVARGRIETAWILVLTLATSLPLLVYANSQDALSSNAVLLRPHDAEGRRVLVALAVAALVCAVGSLAVGRLSSLLSHGQRRRTVGIALAGAATLLAASALIARPPAGGPIEWADRQVESFKRFDPRARDSATSVADRLVVSAGSGRWQNWSVAGAQFTEAPLFGTGAGDYSFRWASERDIDISVQNAHSLYLEVLGESGLIGLLLLLTPLGAVVIAVGSALRRRPPFPLARDLGIAIAACGTVALHLAGDWAWQMPAVVIPAVALGAAAIAASAVERGVPPTGPRIIPVAIAAVSAVAILTISSPVAGAFRLADAREHALRGDLPGALRIARDAGDVDPQSPGPYQLEANLLADLDKPRMSDAAFARAMSASPREWSIPADWASALLRRGDVGAARPLIRRALALNPREPRLALLRREVGI